VGRRLSEPEAAGYGRSKTQQGVLDVRTSFLGAALAAAVLAGAAYTQPAAAQGQGTSVVVVDVNYILKNHVRFKEAQDAMKKEVEQIEEHIRVERDAIGKMAEQLKVVLPDSPDYKRLEESIAERTSKLQLETARARKEVMGKDAKLMYDTYQEVYNHVANFARQNNISLVLRFSSEPIESDDRNSVFQGINRTVVYQNQLNITPHILRQVNGNAPAPQPTPGPAGPISGRPLAPGQQQR
jgi:Skp family chaperone for outer membrane proteins